MQTYQPTYDYGPGKEQYGVIARAFDDAFGLPYRGMDRWWRDPMQYHAFKQLLYTMAGGIIPLVKHYATNPDGSPFLDWPDVTIDLFGPFTGAQHEFGGNEYLAAACYIQGLGVSDLAFWLLAGAFARHPQLFDPNEPGSYYYNAAHPKA